MSDVEESITTGRSIFIKPFPHWLFSHRIVLTVRTRRCIILEIIISEIETKYLLYPGIGG